MEKNHEQYVEEAFERLLTSDVLKKYKREDFEDFFWEHWVEDFVPVIAHFYVPKGVIPLDETFEVFSERQISNVLRDRTRLKDFVKEIAKGKTTTAEEATEVLNSLTHEAI